MFGAYESLFKEAGQVVQEVLARLMSSNWRRELLHFYYVFVPQPSTQNLMLTFHFSLSRVECAQMN